MDTYALTKRRNLVLSSLLLFLISFSGIELGQDLSVSSVKFYIRETTVIYIMIWGIFIYFFVRFLHCLIDIENKDADNARELISFFNPPFYELQNVDGYDTFFRKILRIITFFMVYIFQLSIIVGRSIFEKSFLEYFFPILFAVFVGFTSFYSPFMESKKEKAYVIINKFWCGTRHTVHDTLLPDLLIEYHILDVSCEYNTSLQHLDIIKTQEESEKSDF